jgi:hypothetical protein
MEPATFGGTRSQARQRRMIYPTSAPYEIETYDLATSSLYQYRTPKNGVGRPNKVVKPLPQDVIDRVHALTDNLRFRHFVKGSSLARIEIAWLFICFESPVPYKIISELRRNTGLNMEQWSFYTFDEEKLQDFLRGGHRPDVDVMSFSGMEIAEKAMNHLGLHNFLAELKLRADGSYFIFANHSIEQSSGVR